MSFFKNALASMVGTILAVIALTGLLVLLIISAIASSKDGTEVELKDESILHLVIDGTFSERASEHGSGLGSPFAEEQGTGLNQFIADLEDARDDERIKGMFLEVKSVMAAPSTMRDVRKAIEDFRSSGKWIVAYSEFFTQSGYYLASAADEVYMYPEGEFDWRGLNAEIMFFKNMLDKLEIEAQIIRGPDNKFKSAVEPFMYDKMSDANREQTATFVGDIWRLMLEDIASSRGVTVDALNQGADSLSFISADNAVSGKLLTGLKYRDEVIDAMKGKLGMEVTAVNEEEEEEEGMLGQRKNDLPLIALKDFHKASKKEKNNAKDKVAVVYAVGGISGGEGDDQNIGSDRIAKALRAAREDKKVKAIVLRVNSPGGSALASDVIWRETMLIKESGKPFVVSMGDYAASGGYYIACGADKIFANPNTITGSIGVFGVLPNMQKFLENKIGLTFDRYETNPHADMMSAVKPLEESEMKAFQEMVSDIYSDFTSKVAAGRNMTQAQVDSIGQGRVWSGEDAMQIGLVDAMGDLQDAIEAAAAMASLTEYSLRELPKMVDPFEEFMKELSGEEQADIAKDLLLNEFPLLKEIESMRNMKGVQARMPFLITID